MPTYDNPFHGVHDRPLFDFGAAAGNNVSYICGPPGHKGVLKSVRVALTEATVFATTLGMVKIGTTGNDDAYAWLNIATSQSANTIFDETDDTDAIILAAIPADTVLMVTQVEGTGGGLTGQGTVHIFIDWYK